MVKLYNISDWNLQPWFNTGGTRAKKYFHSREDNHFYYFKQSEAKRNTVYIYEFWSEIIAYELGKMLGFDTLRYDIAIYKDKIGCLSKDMIDLQREELIEGGKYLNAFDNTFVYEDKKTKSLLISATTVISSPYTITLCERLTLSPSPLERG